MSHFLKLCAHLRRIYFWGVFGFFVGLAILVDIAVLRVTQAEVPMVLGVHVSSVADDVVVTLVTRFIRTKCEKCFVTS